MGSRKAPGLGPGVFAIARSQPQQPAHLVQREAKLPGPANEPEPRHIIAVVTTEPATAFAASLGQQANPLVVADRLDIAARSPGKPADSDPGQHENLPCIYSCYRL